MFMCQRDSFLSELKTKVKSCIEITGDDFRVLCKQLSIDDLGDVGVGLIYEIILEDTILFPEGGGQPDDRGTIDHISILRVIRKGNEAVHYGIPSNSNSTKGLEVGQDVTVKLDWKLRFDHMQQHSGQHLITAVTDTLYGYNTTSWWLGSDDSYIELNAKDISHDQIRVIEETVNDKIRKNVPVKVDIVELSDPKLKVARGRNLPEDVTSNIRIVTMDGIESNVCCGTHVSSLSQLQVVKILYAEKKKGKLLLHFLVGDRVLHKFSDMYSREQKLIGILKSTPNELVPATEKLGLTLKTMKKANTTLTKDLIAMEASSIIAKDNETPSVLKYYHRDNVEPDFGVTLLRELGQTKPWIVLITLKTEGNQGHFYLRGQSSLINSEKLNALGEELSNILDGKGFIRGDLYQAKVGKMNLVNKAKDLFLNFKV